jgi:cytidylate kinase
LTIAISREAGANGCEVAHAIGARLGWPVYDRELVQMLADHMGVHAGIIEELDERRASWLRECVEAFADVHRVSHTAYVRHLVPALLTLAAHGQCVLVGRGAPHLLPRASTLRIRLVGKREDRIAVIQKRRGLSRDDAARWIDREDRERAGFVKDHFHTAVDDPRHYDLIINSSHFSIDECAAIAIEALHQLQARRPIAAAPEPVAAGMV